LNQDSDFFTFLLSQKKKETIYFSICYLYFHLILSFKEAQRKKKITISIKLDFVPLQLTPFLKHFF